ncbi:MULTISPECIES: TonB-dependent receptor [unclassified Pseudoalteromonas]|uniref:TonB-dependent receptor n=1 Tax=unclassified Pseudoalteromonas TaxID=194690 RepID=UPI0005AB336F|nr:MULTISPECIES: TonB-dependent receptor [unclassified Pseudoalteromonas]
MKHQIFSKTKLATSLSLILSAVSFTPAYAADEKSVEDIEVIAVTGMRSSIKESTRLKRDSAGVVDAISAEDIGKFPDTNLAESLQRITGVSINRSNGEGSQVTVRGFGPNFNMVTLNGRAMPAASLPGGGGSPNSRAFDFANLASDSIKSVEVYKTGKANIATGGIGATININTSKPLDNPGLQASFGAKAQYDTTNRVGDDVTPEVSGLLSWTDEEEVFGVSVTASMQKRSSGTVGAYTNQWRTSEFDGSIAQQPTEPESGAPVIINNSPAIGQMYSMPSDLRYTIADRERTRTNAQFTFQFRPADSITTTLDYTYSKQDLNEQRAEQSIWMDTYKSSLTFDDNTVKTPVLYNEERREQLPRDLGLAVQELNQVNENKSIGFNLEYEASDYLTIVFDAHDSSSEAAPDAGYGSWVNFGMGANIAKGQGVDYTTKLPTMYVDFDDCARTNLNCNNTLDASDVGSSILDMNYASQRTDITQVRLEAQYDFEDSSINFGIESRSMESHSLQSLTRHTMGNWGVENPGEIPDGYLTPVDMLAEFDDFDTKGGFSQGFTGSASQLGKWAAGEYGFDFAADGAYATNRTIKEDITAAFAQYSYSGDFNGHAYNIIAGLRYESTDSTSTANIDLPNAVAWEGNNDFNVRFGSSKENFSLDNSYDHFLPNLDFDIEVVDDVKARFSYSKTIARPTYNDLSSAATVSGPGAPTLIPGASPATASTGNPSLIPLESDNIDLSLEWYFDDTSYVSAGYYQKNVENFIGIEPVTQNFYGLRDATSGPRAQAAIAELESMGLPITDSNLFQMVAATENGVAFDSMSYEEFEAAYDVLPNSDDPLMDFVGQTPVNNKEAKIDGFELAVQHFFGETGFGFQANYTTVNGDIGFDVNAPTSVTQFALVGLSDTANLVLMYENDEFQARIAYNWRDDFLANGARYQNEPEFIESYSQIDFNVSYNVNEKLSVFFEGINITEENSRSHGRTTAQMWNLEQLGARYALGARYSF